MDVREPTVFQNDSASPSLTPPTSNEITNTSARQGKEALKDIAFGSIAGVVGKYVEYPFDTVKVRLQSQADGVPLKYAGPLDCFRQSLRQDGFLGLYRGISAPLLGAALETSSLFFSYRIAQDIVQSYILPNTDPLPLSALIACGAASGAFTSLVLTPIELVKCKMQVPLETRGRVVAKPGLFTLIGTIYRYDGLSGFWRGQLGTLIRETGGSAAWFGGYEAVSAAFRSARLTSAKRDGQKQSVDNEEALPIYQQMFAGAVAGMSYNFLFFPADTIKSRMQTEDVASTSGRRQSFFAVGRALWTQHGLKGMYRGCGITCARSAPSSALIFSIYEGLRRAFGDV